MFLGLIVSISAEIHVSPDGDDANPGTETAPFATLERARQAVRGLNATMSGDLIVHLAPGTYPVSSPVVFDENDSGMNGHEVIYRCTGAPGSARLVGGLPVEGWLPWQDGIVYADLALPEFHTLYENGRRARKARFPNLVPDPELPLAKAGYLKSTGVNGSYRQLQYADGAFDPTSWDISAARVHVWSGGKWDWFTDTTPIAAIDHTTRTITLAEESRYPLYRASAGSRFYIEGVLALLDEPGEFHYDAAIDRLYYWPMDGPAAEQEIIVPRVRRVLSLAGAGENARVRMVRFEGLGIEYTDFTGWYRHAHVRGGDAGEPRLYPQFDRQATLPQHREGAVRLENTEDVTFDSCSIRNTGYSGIAAFDANRRVTVRRCRISHNGMHGVFFEGRYPGEGDVQTLNTVENCLIHDVGELAGQASGVQLTNASRHTVAHCVIHNSPRYAVTVNAYVDIPLADVYAYGNHFHHLRIGACSQDSGDTAPVYAWGLSDDSPYHVNRFELLLIDDTFAHPSITDIIPNGVFLDNDTLNQELVDIEIRRSQGAPFRTNGTGGTVLENVSWQAGFDPQRMNYHTIGVASDHPFAVPPVRLEVLMQGGEVALQWLPVANAAQYTVYAASSADGPWEAIATGLTEPSYIDPALTQGGRLYRITSTGPYGDESDPSATVQIGLLGKFVAARDGINSFQSSLAANPDPGGAFSISGYTEGYWSDRSDGTFNIAGISPSGGYQGQNPHIVDGNYYHNEVVTTLTLTPNATYDIYIIFGAGGGSSAGIQDIDAGFTSGSLTTMTEAGATDTGFDLATGSGWFAVQRLIGTATADSSGNLRVYVNAAPGAERSIYNGLAYVQVSAPDRFPLIITPTTTSTTGFDLKWRSQSGKLYNLRTSTDLAVPIVDWDLLEGDIPATPPTNLYNVDPADPRRFYAVEEFDAPSQ